MNNYVELLHFPWKRNKITSHFFSSAYIWAYRILNGSTLIMELFFEVGPSNRLLLKFPAPFNNYMPQKLNTSFRNTFPLSYRTYTFFSDYNGLERKSLTQNYQFGNFPVINNIQLFHFISKQVAKEEKLCEKYHGNRFIVMFAKFAINQKSSGIRIHHSHHISSAIHSTREKKVTQNHLLRFSFTVLPSIKF